MHIYIHNAHWLYKSHRFCLFINIHLPICKESISSHINGRLTTTVSVYLLYINEKTVSRILKNHKKNLFIEFPCENKSDIKIKKQKH